MVSGTVVFDGHAVYLKRYLSFETHAAVGLATIYNDGSTSNSNPIPTVHSQRPKHAVQALLPPIRSKYKIHSC